MNKAALKTELEQHFTRVTDPVDITAKQSDADREELAAVNAKVYRVTYVQDGQPKSFNFYVYDDGAAGEDAVLPSGVIPQAPVTTFQSVLEAHLAASPIAGVVRYSITEVNEEKKFAKIVAYTDADPAEEKKYLAYEEEEVIFLKLLA